jgi:phage baseplate assembly protein V
MIPLVRLWNMIAFGSLGPVNDSGPVQTAQVTVGYQEVQDARPVVGLFGLATNPPAGADVVVLYQAGDRSKGLVIGVNHQGTRPTGQAPGETTVFNAFEMAIALTQGGVVINGGGKSVTIENAGGTVNINSGGTVMITGTLIVNGGPIINNGTIVDVP